MEFIALAAALKLQTLCKNSATPQQPIQAAPVKSDANSIVSMLAGRGKRLRQITKDHHLLLQCIDNSLHQGCPTPVHVKSHAERRKEEHAWNDRAADKDNAILQSKGLTLEIKEITALELYNTLLEQGQ
jgi:hypothetical protein